MLITYFEIPKKTSITTTNVTSQIVFIKHLSFPSPNIILSSISSGLLSIFLYQCQNFHHHWHKRGFLCGSNTCFPWFNSFYSRFFLFLKNYLFVLSTVCQSMAIHMASSKVSGILWRNFSVMSTFVRARTNWSRASSSRNWASISGYALHANVLILLLRSRMVSFCSCFNPKN